MLRLTILILASLVAIWLVMASVTPGRKHRDPVSEAERPDLVPLLIPAPAPEPAPDDALSASDLAPDAQDPADPVPETAAQPTRYRDHDMPGPPLHPSPQYPDTGAPSDEDRDPDQAQPAESAGQKQVTASRLNLRAGPGTEHAVIGAVSAGDLVTPQAAESGGWQQVATSDGQTGYLATRFLSDPPE